MEVKNDDFIKSGGNSKLLQYINRNQTALIVLHEIYGINKHIDEVCHAYHMEGYDVYCPNLLQEKGPFTYNEVDEAYGYFMNHIGFEIYIEINQEIEKLKKRYEKVFVIGFSIGATIAWRCSENNLCDGVICCYGSRIRDYLSVLPKVPVLVAFAKHDTFQVHPIAQILKEKEKTDVHIMDANHGFYNPYSSHYNQIASSQFNQIQKAFLTIHKASTSK